MMFCNCSRKALRPALFVERNAASANRMKSGLGRCGRGRGLRVNGVEPPGGPDCSGLSICRASLSPMGRDDLIWLHMLVEVSRVEAKDCSSPWAGRPSAQGLLRVSPGTKASAFCLRVTVVLDTYLCDGCDGILARHCRRGLTTG